MISVGSGNEAQLSQLFANLLGEDLFSGQFGDIAVQFFCDVAPQCVAATLNLECVESKTFAFVLDLNTLHP